MKNVVWDEGITWQLTQHDVSGSRISTYAIYYSARKIIYRNQEVMYLLHQVMLIDASIEHMKDVKSAAAIADVCESNPNVSQFLPFLKFNDVINKMKLNSAVHATSCSSCQSTSTLRRYQSCLIIQCSVNWTYVAVTPVDIDPTALWGIPILDIWLSIKSNLLENCRLWTGITDVNHIQTALKCN